VDEVSQPSTNPLTLRQQLATALRHFRYEANLPQAGAADRLDWSVSTVVRHESGAIDATVSDVRSMLSCYEVIDPPTVEKYISIGRTLRAARRRSDIVAPSRSTDDRRRFAAGG
jgi:hypothetical protein